MQFTTLTQWLAVALMVAAPIAQAAPVCVLSWLVGAED